MGILMIVARIETMQGNSTAAWTRACGLILFLAALILSSTSTRAEFRLAACPYWRTVYSTAATPEEAATKMAPFLGFQNCMRAAYTCAPTSDGNGHFNATFMDCGNGYPECGIGADGLHDRSQGSFGTNTNYCVSDFNGGNAGPTDCPSCQKGAGGPCPGCGIGNPINAGTGNKYHVETDFREGGLEFTRYYNSQVPIEFGIAMRWRHNWDRRVFSAPGVPMVEVYRGDSKSATYHEPTSGTVWTHAANVVDELERLVDGTWKLTTRDLEVEIYDSSGRFVSMTSAAGDVTTLAYTDGTATGTNGAVYEDAPTTPVIAGKLLRITDFKGRSIQLGYRTDGSLAKMVDPAGGVYLYTVGGPYITLTAVTFPGGKTRQYLYNEPAFTSFPQSAYLTGIIDEAGARYSTYRYASDYAISTELGNGVAKYTFNFPNSTGADSYTDPLQTVRQTTFARFLDIARPTGVTQPCPGCTPSTATQTYGMDATGNVTSVKDFNGNLACYSYDARNLEISRTEGLSGAGTCTSRQATSATRTITTEWHDTKRLRKRVAEPLRITSYNYNGEPGVSCAPAGSSTNLLCSKVVQATTDADGSLAFSGALDGAARTWAFSYNAAGQLLTVDGPRTDVVDVTTYTYYTTSDSSGNYRIGDLASVRNALNQTTQYLQYDGAGRLKKSIDPNGLETLLDYWPRGWIKSRQVGTAASGYETTLYDYDDNGSLAKITAPDGSFVTYTYDAAHRLTDIQDGLGNRIHYTLDNAGNRTAEDAYDSTNTLVRKHSRTFDALSRLANDIGGTNPTSQITVHAYDAKGNLTSITDPASRVTTQLYDARDRLKEVRDPFNGSAAPTLYEYNGQDLLKKVTDPNSLATSYTYNGHGELLTQSSPDTGTTTFTYDAASNLKTKLDARAVQATYAYDAINRLTQITYPDQTVTYAYDTCANGVGRLCSITDSTGSTAYTYDAKGRIATKSQVIGSVTRTMTYAYNAAGQLTSVTLPSGRVVSYGYTNNRPVSVAVGSTSILSSVFYEPFGPNGGWVWGNGTPASPNTHTRVYDKDFRMTRVTSDRPATGSQPYFDRQIVWHPSLNRIEAINDLANGALNSSYGYDALDRLTSSSQTGATRGYTYNGTGDRLTSTVNGATTTYGYFAGTHRLQSLSGAQSKSYTVDAVGNMTSDGLATWTYGGNNRPTQAGATSFGINALGQRVKKTSAGSTTYFVYDEAGRLWGEYDASGAPITETVWLEDLPVAVLK